MKLIRLLIYEGTPEAIERTMSRNGIKRVYQVPNMTIREVIIWRQKSTLIKALYNWLIRGDWLC